MHICLRKTAHPTWRKAIQQCVQSIWGKGAGQSDQSSQFQLYINKTLRRNYSTIITDFYYPFVLLNLICSGLVYQVKTDAFISSGIRHVWFHSPSLKTTVLATPWLPYHSGFTHLHLESRYLNNKKVHVNPM